MTILHITNIISDIREESNILQENLNYEYYIRYYVFYLRIESYSIRLFKYLVALRFLRIFLIIQLTVFIMIVIVRKVKRVGFDLYLCGTIESFQESFISYTEVIRYNKQGQDDHL